MGFKDLNFIVFVGILVHTHEGEGSLLSSNANQVVQRKGASLPSSWALRAKYFSVGVSQEKREGLPAELGK
jgi:hypothetical protein